MRKAYILLSHCDGRIQLLRKYQKAAVNIVCFRNEGMTIIPVDQMADIEPDTHRTILKLRSEIYHTASLVLGI